MPIKLDDAELELLGNYFTDNDIRATTGLTFHQFIVYYQFGCWQEVVE